LLEVRGVAGGEEATRDGRGGEGALAGYVAGSAGGGGDGGEEARCLENWMLARFWGGEMGWRNRLNCVEGR
jgi:hypothetical protein